MPLWEGRTVLLLHFPGYDTQADLGRGFVSTAEGTLPLEFSFLNLKGLLFKKFFSVHVLSKSRKRGKSWKKATMFLSLQSRKKTIINDHKDEDFS